MVPERSRIAEVWSGGGGEGRSGSGYLIGSRHVLTAAHVVEGSGLRVDVRCLGQDEWAEARVAWRDAGRDVALLEISDRGWVAPAVSAMRWGRIWGVEPVGCLAVGFPDAQERPEQVRESEQ